MTDTNWDVVGRNIGVPMFWRLTAKPYRDRWKLTADGRQPLALALRCGHRSVEVTAPTLPEAVAYMVRRLRDHEAGI